MNEKKLSIVIPTIGRTILDQTIESALKQNVLPYEIVIWDNSGDGRAFKQSKYKDDSALKWCISEYKKDIVSSWNSAVECTSGEYVYILGDDDLLLPGFIEKTLQKLSEGAELIHTTAQIIDSNNAVIKDEKTGIQNDQILSEWEFIDKHLNYYCDIYLGSLVFPREGYEKVGGFKNIVMNALSMDILFNLEMVMLYGQITVLAAPIWQYRKFVSDWCGALKSKKDVPILIKQYSMLRKYMAQTRLIENKSLFALYERKGILMTLVQLIYSYKKLQCFKLFYSKEFSLKERYYMARDLFYLLRH